MQPAWNRHPENCGILQRLSRENMTKKFPNKNFMNYPNKLVRSILAGLHLEHYYGDKKLFLGIVLTGRTPTQDIALQMNLT